MSSNVKYQALTPVSNADDKGHYFEALNFAIKHEKITNIAITGPYGSGKSSVIDSFIENNNEINSIKVSLAEFGGVVNTDDKAKLVQKEIPELVVEVVNNESENNNGEVGQLPQIEKSILQQIFYQVSEKKIAYSRFKRIKHFSDEILNGSAWTVVLFLIVILYLFNLSTIESVTKYISNNFHHTKDYYWIYFLLSGMAILCLTYFVARTAVETISKLKITSFNIQSVGEIKLDDKTGSILNFYLDEIVYFFEQERIDVVFFEDLDRFKGVDIQIFTKLRELNHLLNNCESIQYPVNFIFALKDDMFHCNEERTKFFDFLVPIIPYINRSNSANLLKTSFFKTYPKLKTIVSEEFLERVAHYISDMRTLINIQNEFHLYLQNLNNHLGENQNLLNHEKLFGFMVYKNVYPQDFAHLNKGEGKVIEALASKNKKIKEIFDDLSLQIKEVRRLVEIAKNEVLTDIDDLRKLANQKILSLATGLVISHVSFDEERMTIEEFLNNTESTENNFKKSMDFEDKDSYRAQYVTRKSITPSNLTEISAWYSNRKKTIENKLQLEKFHSQIKGFEQKQQEVKAMTIGDIISTNQHVVDSLWSDKDDKNELLVYLLSGDYIDDHYDMYLTYFHEGGLTLNDLKFVQNIQNQIHTEFSYVLNNPKKVAERLGPKYIPDVLNISFITYLLKETDYKAKASYLKNIIDKKLCLNDEHSEFSSYEDFGDFILEFMHTSSESDGFIMFLIEYWPGFWDFICFMKFSDDEKNKILSLTFENPSTRSLIENVDFDSVVGQDHSGMLSSYILEMPDFLAFAGRFNSFSRINIILEKLNIQFSASNFSKPTAENIVFQSIYNDNLYVIDFETVKLMLSVFGDDFYQNEEYQKRNLSYILNSGCDALIRYLESNWQEYFSKIYHVLEAQQESPKFIAEVLELSDTKLPGKYKEILLKNQLDKFENMSDYPEIWYEFMLNNYLVKPSWQNMLTYFSLNEEVDDCLFSFLNKTDHAEILSGTKLNKDVGKDALTQSLSRKIILNNNLSDDVYQYLMDSMYWWYQDIDFTGLNTSKVRMLIETQTIRLTESCFKKITDNFTRLKPLLIKKHFDEFIENYSIFELTSEEITEYIGVAKMFTNVQKIAIINVEANHITNNLEDYIPNLLYVLLENDSDHEVDYNLLEAVLAHTDVEVEDKLSILNSQLDYLSREQVFDCVKLLGGNYSKLVVDKFSGKPFDDTEQNKVLFSKMSKLKLIGRNKPTKKGLIVYSVSTLGLA